jgi:hypothetical protein
MKTKLVLGLLKISIFVIVYSIDWLLSIVIILILFITPNSAKYLSYSSLIFISSNSCSVSISSFYSDSLLIPSNSARNILKYAAEIFPLVYYLNFENTYCYFSGVYIVD